MCLEKITFVSFRLQNYIKSVATRLQIYITQVKSMKTYGGLLYIRCYFSEGYTKKQRISLWESAVFLFVKLFLYYNHIVLFYQDLGVTLANLNYIHASR